MHSIQTFLVTAAIASLCANGLLLLLLMAHRAGFSLGNYFLIIFDTFSLFCHHWHLYLPLSRVVHACEKIRSITRRNWNFRCSFSAISELSTSVTVACTVEDWWQRNQMLSTYFYFICRSSSLKYISSIDTYRLHGNVWYRCQVCNAVICRPSWVKKRFCLFLALCLVYASSYNVFFAETAKAMWVIPLRCTYPNNPTQDESGCPSTFQWNSFRIRHPTYKWWYEHCCNWISCEILC